MKRLSMVIADYTRQQFVDDYQQFVADAIDTPFPRYRPLPTPVDIRHWTCTTSPCPTLAGSGNAHVRWFLEHIFPVYSSVGLAHDHTCLASHPFFGVVDGVPGLVVGNRVHGVSNAGERIACRIVTSRYGRSQ